MYCYNNCLFAFLHTPVQAVTEEDADGVADQAQRTEGDRESRGGVCDFRGRAQQSGTDKERHNEKRPDRVPHQTVDVIEGLFFKGKVRAHLDLALFQHIQRFGGFA